MTEQPQSLEETLKADLGEALVSVVVARGETTLTLQAGTWVESCRQLRDDHGFEQLIDLCGVDFLAYGEDEWDTEEATSESFSRGVEGNAGPGRFDWQGRPDGDLARRFAVVVHLLSIRHNRRLRVITFVPDDAVPAVPSLVEIWASANWYEREAFDLYGIVFEGHPDLRRILTDYGFIGHPMRKDFPLIGNVEVRYDPEKGRVVYQPVTIEPRVLVPKVIRDDSRYAVGDGTQKGS